MLLLCSDSSVPLNSTTVDDKIILNAAVLPPPFTFVLAPLSGVRARYHTAFRSLLGWYSNPHYGLSPWSSGLGGAPNAQTTSLGFATTTSLESIQVRHQRPPDASYQCSTNQMSCAYGPSMPADPLAGFGAAFGGEFML